MSTQSRPIGAPQYGESAPNEAIRTKSTGETRQSVGRGPTTVPIQGHERSDTELRSDLDAAVAAGRHDDARRIWDELARRRRARKGGGA